LDVDLSKPGYVLDTTIISHFCEVALTYVVNSSYNKISVPFPINIF